MRVFSGCSESYTSESTAAVIPLLIPFAAKGSRVVPSGLKPGPSRYHIAALTATPKRLGVTIRAHNPSDSHSITVMLDLFN